AAGMHATTNNQDSTQAPVQRARTDLRPLAQRIAELRLSSALKAGAQGKVLGSVTNRDIVEALAARGIAIERSKIHLAEPIRSLGTHRVVVRLLPDVQAEIAVEVTTA